VPRRVRVDRFDIVGETQEADGRQVLHVEVDCGAGTYIRALAADLGHLLGTGAHVRNLRRTAVEPFTIEEAAPPDLCTLLPAIEAVRALAKVTVDVEGEKAIAVGKPLPSPPGAGPWAMVTNGNELLAVYEPFGSGTAKPAVVLSTAR
jgi:tRNA pseudouridine55 synthase